MLLLTLRCTRLSKQKSLCTYIPRSWIKGCVQTFGETLLLTCSGEMSKSLAVDLASTGYPLPFCACWPGGCTHSCLPPLLNGSLNGLSLRKRLCWGPVRVCLRNKQESPMGREPCLHFCQHQHCKFLGWRVVSVLVAPAEDQVWFPALTSGR